MMKCEIVGADARMQMELEDENRWTRAREFGLRRRNRGSDDDRLAARIIVRAPTPTPTASRTNTLQSARAQPVPAYRCPVLQGDP